MIAKSLRKKVVHPFGRQNCLTSSQVHLMSNLSEKASIDASLNMEWRVKRHLRFHPVIEKKGWNTYSRTYYHATKLGPFTVFWLKHRTQLFLKYACLFRTWQRIVVGHFLSCNLLMFLTIHLVQFPKQRMKNSSKIITNK